MPQLLDEIKSRVSGVKSAPRDIIGLVKSKARNVVVNDRVVRRLTNRIGDSGIVGQDSYNAHAKEVRRLLKSGDLNALKGYVNNQKAKVDKEVKEDIERKRAKYSK